jgi:hypothetical protein
MAVGESPTPLIVRGRQLTKSEENLESNHRPRAGSGRMPMATLVVVLWRLTSLYTWHPR